MASKLTARKVETAKPGKYSDGGNLYLIVSETGARKWVLRFTWRGRAKEMGLGSAASVPLADAREKAASARRKIAQGLNPIDERKRDGGIPTFGEMADDVREALSAGFRNEKHKAQWKSTLETYAAPLRGRPVDTIAIDDVLAVLKPIWTTKAETASRVRGGSKRFWTPLRPKDSAWVRTLPDGAVIWTTCYRDRRSWRGAITPRCPMRMSPPSLQS
jgi:Arm DNA-binding domain